MCRRAWLCMCCQPHACGLHAHLETQEVWAAVRSRHLEVGWLWHGPHVSRMRGEPRARRRQHAPCCCGAAAVQLLCSCHAAACEQVRMMHACGHALDGDRCPLHLDELVHAAERRDVLGDERLERCRRQGCCRAVAPDVLEQVLRTGCRTRGRLRWLLHARACRASTPCYYSIQLPWQHVRGHAGAACSPAQRPTR